MNKETFLAQLREYIQVLEEQEQEDILEEYAQHIDMKRQKGLSEEEAIADFGSIKELAAEILEAYHVKPEYGQKKKMRLLPANMTEGEKTPQNAFKRFVKWLKEKGTAAGRFLKSVLEWTGNKCRALAGWLAKPFRHRRSCGENSYGKGDGAMDTVDTVERIQKTDEAIPKTAGEYEVTRYRASAHVGKSVGSGIRNFFCMTGRGCAKLWRLFVLCALFGLRLFWNAGWLLLSLLFAGFAMTALAGVGVLLILYFQNYPFGGILLMALGAVMCFGALSWWAFSLLIRKKTKQCDKAAEDTGLDESDRSGEAFAG